MKSISRLLGGILCAGLVTGTAQADININGFASVGGGWFNGDTTDATRNGYDQHFSADPVNKLGLQFSSVVNDQITATGQLLAKGSKDYDIEAAWAYLSYAVNDDLDVRAGRLRSPFFPYSDFLDVGYAYPWITPPSDVYRFVFDTVEGLDLLYRTDHGDWSTTYQVYYGRLTDETTLGGEAVDLDLENFGGVNVTMNRDWLTLRASYNVAKVNVAAPSAATTFLNQLIATGNADAADQLNVEEEDGAFWGLGALIDYDDWLFNTEYTKIEMDEQSLISSDKAWYAMVGRRFDEITVHFTYSKQESEPDYGFVDAIAGPDAPTTAALQAGARSAIVISETTTMALGVRYELAEATSLKVEASKIENDINDTDGTLIAFAVDTVF